MYLCLDVVSIYCCVSKHPKLNSSKQQPFMTAQDFVGQESWQGVLGMGGLRLPGGVQLPGGCARWLAHQPGSQVWGQLDCPSECLHVASGYSDLWWAPRAPREGPLDSSGHFQYFKSGPEKTEHSFCCNLVIRVFLF